MESGSTEKNWIRKMGGMNLEQMEKEGEEEKKKTGKLEAESRPEPVSAVKGHGLNDVAGMDGLKTLIREDLINVLNHKACAAAYGIKPPSVLFYGPAGCGKTFFAEKVAEEVGIHFMKVVPDDLASHLVHGTQEKIGELFRKAERKAPTLLFLDEFDAMVPRRTDDDGHCQNGEVNEFLCMLNNASERGIYLLVGNEDSKIIAVLLPNMDMADEGEVPLYLAACNKFNRECNLAKVYLDQQMTYVNVSVEQAYTDEASLKDCISRAIEVLSVSRSFFSRTLQELSN